jgi:hypothetical protein
MMLDDLNDGHPRYAIQPGGTYSYDFRINQRAAMNWYHPHPHMLTGEQVVMGLAGAFIVTDSVEDALNLPSGPYEIPLGSTLILLGFRMLPPVFSTPLRFPGQYSGLAFGLIFVAVGAISVWLGLRRECSRAGEQRC